METSNIYNGLFEKVEFCPLCNSSFEYSVVLYEIKHLEWYFKMVRCKNCGLTYKNYFPTEKYFIEIYSQSYGHYSLDNMEEEITLLQHRLKRVGRANGRLLDYGCGNGSFVVAALHGGWDAYGCDPYLPDILPDEINTRCFKADISNDVPPGIGNFNCITMWATAEHLVDSLNTFLNLFSLLDKDGLFIFNSPFGNSKIAMKDGAVWRMSNIVEHLQFHTFKSINYLSSVGNMKIESIRVCGQPYPMGRMIHNNVVEIKQDETDANKSADSKKKRANSFKSYLLTHVIAKNIFYTKDILSYFINQLKNGDHIEAIFKKK